MGLTSSRPEPTTAEKMRRLPWSLAGNAANAVYSQLTFFGSVFVLFLSQLGLTKSTIGALLSLIPFFGLIALVAAPSVARFGYKRAYITCFTLRKFITLALLATPWVLERFGTQALFWTAVAIISAFSLFRAIAITGSHPWEQEYIPDAVRGKYAAANQGLIGVAGFLTIGAASAYLGPDPGLERFMALFLVGTAVGLASLLAFVYVPGGAPERASTVQGAHARSMLRALRDPNLAYFLAGLGLVTLASTGLGSFVTLFMRETIGLDAGQVVRLQAAGLVGGLLTSFAWGWAADRYGSRPVMLLGLYAKAALPVLWFTLPRGSAWTLPLALGAAAWQGMANMGWTIGSTRLLFTDVVPPPKRLGYMAVHYAWLSIVEGLSQVFSGRLLDATAGLQGRWLGFELDRYSLLFAAGVLLPLLGSLPLRRVRAGGSLGVRQLAGLFLRGRPWLALGSLVGFRLARDEPAVVAATERLGQARSPLTVVELVESLADPRFNVRYEAVVSMAHHGADPRLTRALVETLGGPDPALSAAAAWALGRSGDRQAVPALRAGLGSRYRSVQAHCARSLAALGDAGSAGPLLARLEGEEDPGLRLAYAAALGTLRHAPALPRLLALLREEPSRGGREELALALARLAGEERFFVQLLRQVGAEAATPLAQAARALGKRLREPALGRAAACLAQGDLEAGTALLAGALRPWAAAAPDSPAVELLRACLEGMQGWAAGRMEVTVLALHAAQAAVRG